VWGGEGAARAEEQRSDRKITQNIFHLSYDVNIESPHAQKAAMATEHAGVVMFLSLPIAKSLLSLVRRNTPSIYDTVILHMTSLWYRTTLLLIPAKSTVLDIGMGTGTSLLANVDLVRSQNLQIVGVDFTESYVSAANSNFERQAAAGFLSCNYGSVYDAALLKSLAPPTLFDAVYFSGSIALMPDPVAALNAVEAVLKTGQCVYVTQTFQRRSLPGLAVIKPMVKHLTTIDFGQLCFEPEILDIYSRCNLELVSHEVIPNSVDNMWQAAYISVLRKATATNK
jgi:alpha-N-acetylglucosaminidase